MYIYIFRVVVWCVLCVGTPALVNTTVFWPATDAPVSSRDLFEDDLYTGKSYSTLVLKDLGGRRGLWVHANICEYVSIKNTNLILLLTILVKKTLRINIYFYTQLIDKPRHSLINS